MTYIHPADKNISDFTAAICKSDNGLETICRNVFACYAYVHKDCYGHRQDHICAAVSVNSQCILIDATQPYRKWHGFDCPHQDYELLSPDEFERRMKQEESYWCSVAEKHRRTLLAGLLYAPWIHAECILESKESLDNVFFLLTLDNRLEPTLYVYYQHYTPQKSTMPIMSVISTEKMYFHFSIHLCNDLWDDKQWSKGFEEVELPTQYISDELLLMKHSILKVLPQINRILKHVECHTLITRR